MKDFIIKHIPKDAIYKNVVIIGNGPSGITLSYMLAGNWPYWNPEKIQKHPDELLRARLNYADCTKSLIEHDLITLAEGLEGRTTNPVSLLYDSLEHPCADLGMELPSMLEYKYHPNAKIDHIVLGKGPPGGSWHRMDPNLRTLSLASWMSLPGFSYNDWELLKQIRQKQQRKKFDSNNSSVSTPLELKIHKVGNLSFNLRRQAMKNSSSIPLSNTTNNIITDCEKCLEIRLKQKSKNNRYLKNPDDPCNNCDDNEMENNNESETGSLCCKCTKALNQISIENLTKINQNDTEIPIIPGSPPRRNLSLKRQVSKEVQSRALVSRVAKYYEDYVHLMGLDKYFMNDAIVMGIAPIQDGCAQGKFRLARWLIYGVNRITGRPFYFACSNVVLANGTSDLPNRLGIQGENMNSSWVKHELPELEEALESMNEDERKSSSSKGLKPILIIGAGLSAADAVTICRSSNIPVIHVFRSRTAGLDKMLPENVYPEYHEVHRMMKDLNNKYEYYTPVPEHTISDLKTDANGAHQVTVKHIHTGEEQIYDVSFCAILIGSKPDLRFVTLKPCVNNKDTMSITSSLITDKSSENNFTLIARKLSWLKNFCAKCKHLNVCDWNLNRSALTQQQQNSEQNVEHNRQNKIMNDKELSISLNSSPLSVSPVSSPLTTSLIPFNTVNEETGLGLGYDPTKPIDCKTNQIAVNKFTNEVINGPKGLYAMGPLVGDNFVRFIPGGALAITAALNREKDSISLQ